MSNYVPGCGNPRAKLAVVGEAPGADEDIKQEPFVGPTGKLVTDWLQLAGVSREDVWLTNVVKFRPPDNDMKRLPEIGVDLAEQTDALWTELRNIRPNCILALGETALTALTNYSKISKYRGSIVECKDASFKCVPSIHPAALFKEQDGKIKYSARVYLQFDFKRAVEQSAFPEIRHLKRLIHTAKSSLDVHQFFRRNHGLDKASVDIEAHASLPLCVGIAFSKYEAITIPLAAHKTSRGSVEIPTHDLAFIWQFLDTFFRGPTKKIGQNFKYDETKLRQVGFRVNNFYSDTLLKSHVVFPELPHNLAFLTSVWTEEPFYKDEGRFYVPGKDDLSQLFNYNGKDAAVTFEIDEELESDLVEMGLQDFYYGFVMQLHSLYMQIEREGLLVDAEKRAELNIKYTALENQVDEELTEMVGHPVNVNSNGAKGQVGRLLFEELKIPPRSGVAIAQLVEIMNNVLKSQSDPRYKIIKDIIKLRKVRKTRSTYINASPDYDGRMRTIYNICGTETGRTSTSIMEKGLFRPEKMGLAFQTLTKHGDIGSEIRQMLCADPGHVIIEADMSQAEARVVAVLSEDWELLKMFGVVDIHKMTAGWIFETAEKNVDGEQRFCGKTTRHAGNYDMGKNRCMHLINTLAEKLKMDLKISEWKASQFLERFHERSPKIRGIFHAGVVEALEQNNLTLVTPKGRVRQFGGRWGKETFKEAYAQIPQSTVSDHLKESMLLAKKESPDLRICIEAHDAFAALIPANEIKEHEKLFKKVLERPIDFNNCTLKRDYQLTIPAEVKVGENWGEMRDVA